MYPPYAGLMSAVGKPPVCRVELSVKFFSQGYVKSIVCLRLAKSVSPLQRMLTAYLVGLDYLYFKFEQTGESLVTSLQRQLSSVNMSSNG